MKHLIRLTDYKPNDIYAIFNIADEIHKKPYNDFLKGKSIVLFFPPSSIRTRVTFEKGIYLLGGQSILFSPDTLDKKEDLRDVCGYLNQWADMLIVRHSNIHILEQLATYSKVPVINAMTDINHPCEVLTDLYALSKIRKNFIKDKYLFCGVKGNIGLAWKEASEVMGFDLAQCCEHGYEMENLVTYHHITDAIKGIDIICTDSLPSKVLEQMREHLQDFQVTKTIMESANAGTLLNPCPPFYRGEEVSADAIDSPYFVGYKFKKYLLDVQQAIMIYCLAH